MKDFMKKESDKFKETVDPSMYLHDEKGDLIGIPNFETMMLDPIPVKDMESIIFDKPTKNGTISGKWVYKGKKKLMTSTQLINHENEQRKKK